MNILRNWLMSFSLLAAGAAFAAEPVVILHDDAGQNVRSRGQTVDIQQNSGSRCESPAIGSCGSCAVSCPVGEAAICRPGKAVSRSGDASCVIEPSCSCK
jgi:hypothetical protein